MQIYIGNIKHGLTVSVARKMAGSDSDSALGKLAGATVGQEISCSKLGALLETTNCSCLMNSVAKEEITYIKTLLQKSSSNFGKNK